MTQRLKADYKGYIIVPGASWSTQQPFTSPYQIMKFDRGDAVAMMHHGFCPGVFDSENEAWRAAEIAARSYIDASLPTDGRCRALILDDNEDAGMLLTLLGMIE